MKRFMVVIAIMAMALSASFAFAGGKENVSSKVDADQNQQQQQGQIQGQGQSQSSNNVNINAPSASSSSSSNNLNDVNNDVENTNVMKGGTQNFLVHSVDNSRSLGSLPEAYTHGAQLPIFPMTEYGHLIEQFSLKTSTQILSELSYDNFKIFADNLQEEGVDKWDKINKKIKVYPVAINRFQRLGDSDAVWFPTPEEFFRILPLLGLKDTVAVYMYDTEFDKKSKIVATYLQMKALSDSVNKGGNICVPLDQFWQAHFLPEGWDMSIGGVISGIAKSFLSGGSGAANAGLAKGQNTASGNAGAAFAFFRVQNLERFRMLSKPPVPEKIKESPPAVEKPKPELKPEKPGCDMDRIWKKIHELEQKVQKCTRFCFDNLGYRADWGEDDIELFVCTGSRQYLREAIEQYKIAEHNYLHGYDIKIHKAETDGIIAQVYYNWAGCIRELYGREAAMKFAREKKLERIPTGFAR